MNINTRNLGLLAIAGMTALCTSCASLNKTSEKKQQDLQTVALEQFREDSTYYGKVFYMSPLAKDSNVVAEFNKIAASMRNIKSNEKKAIQAEILRNAQNNGISERDEDIIKGFQYTSNKYTIRMQQRFADFFVFEYFLRKLGITERKPDTFDK